MSYFPKSAFMSESLFVFSCPKDKMTSNEIMFCNIKPQFSPQGTLIIPNLTSLSNEEGQWKFPHEFNPENFLNDHGEFVKPEAFMPFSAGMGAQQTV